MGYYMHDGSKWSKDFLVLDLEQAIANAEKYCTVLRVAQVYSPQADLYFPMKDHLIQKVVVQAKVTPQDVLRHIAKNHGNCGPLHEVIEQIKREGTATGDGEDQPSADPRPDCLGEIQPSAPREWPAKTKTETEEHSENGGCFAIPSIRLFEPGGHIHFGQARPGGSMELAVTECAPRSGSKSRMEVALPDHASEAPSC
jgi:hypothetical protein